MMSSLLLLLSMPAFAHHLSESYNLEGKIFSKELDSIVQ